MQACFPETLCLIIIGFPENDVLLTVTRLYRDIPGLVISVPAGMFASSHSKNLDVNIVLGHLQYSLLETDVLALFSSF